MKKSELKVGMIVEDRSYYAQKLVNKPFVLILRVLSNGYHFMRSHSKDDFTQTGAGFCEGFLHVKYFRKLNVN